MKNTTPRLPRAHGARAWLASAALAVTATGALAPACSLVVDRSADQCKEAADCASLLGAGTWSCDQGMCVAAAAECEVTADCIAAKGENHICRKDTHVCAPLTNANCSYVFGDYQNDDAIFLGVLAPFTGTDTSTGMAERNGAELAVSEIMGNVNGLPPAMGSTARRPIVLVGCDDTSDNQTSVDAATFLVETVGVPAIIGPAFSGITIDVSTTVTIPNEVLLISSSATSVALTDLPDNDLVWRTSPSDVFQAAAFIGYMPILEQEIRTKFGLQPADKVKVTILNKGDAYGKGLGTALEAGLQLNGGPIDPLDPDQYQRFDYGNPDDPGSNPTKYPEAALFVTTASKLPHVVLLLGTNETINPLLQTIEESWPVATQAPPVYLFADGGLVDPLWDYVGTDDDLRQRARGTVPGTTNPLFVGFTGAYAARFGPSAPAPTTFGAAGAYDAVYLLAYAIASQGGLPITGPNLVEGLKKMVPPGALTPVGTASLNATFTTLGTGAGIDFDGASGPLNFDVLTGEAPSDVQIWCLPKDGGGNALAGKASGLFFNAATSALEGSINNAICAFN